MNLFRNLKIGGRMTLLVAAAVVAMFAAVIAVTVIRVNQMALDDARTLASADAGQVGRSVQADVNVAMDEARALAAVFEASVNVDGLKLTRRRANMILKYFIERNKDFPDVWAVFEPDAFDGNDANFKGDAGTDETGRFIPVWSRGQDGAGVLEASKDYEKPGPGDYYVIPRSRKQETVIDPYPYTLNGTEVLLSSFVVPVKDAQGKFLGVVGLDLDLSVIQGQFKGLTIGQYQKAYMRLMSGNGTVVANTRGEFIGKSIDEASSDKELAGWVHAGTAFQSVRYSGTLKDNVISIGVPVEIARTGQHWIVNAQISLGEATQVGRTLTLRLLAIAAAAVALVILIVFLIARSISRPLAIGVRFAKRIADGDLTATVDVGHRRDEIGELAVSLNEMTENLRNLARQIQEGAGQLASSTDELSTTAQQLSEGAQSQASTLEETSASVEQLTASVEQVSDHAQSQSSSVTQTSATMDQMMKSVSQVSGTLQKVAASAAGSVAKAQQGADSVKQAVEAIKDISQSSQRIAGIVTVITDIADQTNLLALNASIEAARAGEHGRGFAVVADEVSKLAERSASSTKEIEALIRETLRQVKQGVDLAEGSGRSMTEIINGAREASTMVRDLQDLIDQQVAAIKEVALAVQNLNEMSQGITAATEEQTTNARQVSTAIESVNQLTQQAATSAEQLASSTEELSGMAQQLQGMVSSFKLEQEPAAVAADASHAAAAPVAPAAVESLASS